MRTRIGRWPYRCDRRAGAGFTSPARGAWGRRFTSCRRAPGNYLICSGVDSAGPGGVASLAKIAGDARVRPLMDGGVVMRAFKALRGVGVALCVAIGLTAMAGGAMAAPLRICVPEKEGAAIKTPKKGICAAKTTATVVLPEAEEEKLAAILPYEKYVASGVGGKPTIQVSGANVQIVNGEGKTATTNGEGNLVIGYDENAGKHEQTGSHNLILGYEQTFTSYGGIDAGWFNTITGEYASVSGGVGNVASGLSSSVSGGVTNTASGPGASVSGGEENTASGKKASVSGGKKNEASELYASITGGFENLALAHFSSVSGGSRNTASGERATVSGGYKNTASGFSSSVSGGGENNDASGEYASVTGGEENTASGCSSSVSGGRKNTASGCKVVGEEEFGGSSVAGGFSNTASGEDGTVGGGAGNKAEGYSSSVADGDANRAEGSYASVSGGYANNAQGTYSSILGGGFNTLPTEFGEDY